MNKLITPIVATILAIPLIGIAQNAPQGAVMVTKGPNEAVAAEAVQVQGKVKSIDKQSRIVVVVGKQGKEVTLPLGPEVKNFDQINVGDLVTLTLKAAEQLVPDNEDASVVLVDVDAVAAVVAAVMRGRVHELFEEAQAVDGLGVDPVLVDQADAELHRNRQRVKADEGQRQVEHEGIRRAQGRLAQRSTEVVVLAGMMIDVLHPEQAATVRAESSAS